jgi:hypothetical protein
LNGDAADNSLSGSNTNDAIYGEAGDDTIDGGEGDDKLFGGNANPYDETGNDTIYGGAGNDILDGGLGSDAMFGGTGNDTYIVDDLGDTATEYPNQGVDTVKSSVTFTLGERIDNLFLTDFDDIDGTGNALNNKIVGNSGINTLSRLRYRNLLHRWYGFRGVDWGGARHNKSGRITLHLCLVDVQNKDYQCTIARVRHCSIFTTISLWMRSPFARCQMRSPLSSFQKF